MEATKELKELLAQQVLERDKQELTFGDTLDVKTGLILVALTFLASQSAILFQAGLTYLGKYAQSVSVLALVVGAALAIVELWPRDYDVEARPQKYATWLKDLKEYYSGEPDPDEKVLTAAIDGRIERARERVEKNISANAIKSRLMTISFFCVAISLATNLLTLISKHLS